MMLSVALIAFGYIVAVMGSHSVAGTAGGLLVMLFGWFLLLRSGHGTLSSKSGAAPLSRAAQTK